MFGLPLHPFLVHFPMALAALLPMAALAALAVGFRTGSSGNGRKYWAAVVVLQAFLAVSSFLALQAGQKDEERVEKVLASEGPLETHEEKAELFTKATAAVLVVAALGLAPGMLGMTGRVVGGAASLAILFLGLQVGHSGGQLVYKHGAAAAFTLGNGAGTVADNNAEGGGQAAGKAGKEEAGKEKDED